MNTNNLPTYIDIARHYLCIIDYNKNVEFKDIFKSIKLIWNISSIPVISDKGIKIKFDGYMVHINTLRKKSTRIIFDDLIKNHFEKYDVLFDIASCNCSHRELPMYKYKLIIINRRTDGVGESPVINDIQIVILVILFHFLMININIHQHKIYLVDIYFN